MEEKEKIREKHTNNNRKPSAHARPKKRTRDFYLTNFALFAIKNKQTVPFRAQFPPTLIVEPPGVGVTSRREKRFTSQM
jgi:hypothetical protein